jgi:hypothetical protein
VVLQEVVLVADGFGWPCLDLVALTQI